MRKFPSYCFACEAPPALGRWKLDDEVRDPLCDSVEVSFELGEEVRWLTFVTPAFFARQLTQSRQPFWVQPHLAIVLEITAETIALCLKHLLEQGDLAEHSRLLESTPAEWFEDLPVE